MFANDGDELEKAPAAVSVKVVRKAVGKAQRDRGINVNYGIRSRKPTGNRRKAARKDIGVGDPKTLRHHVSRIFAERCESGGSSDRAYYESHKESWARVEERIDASLKALIEPVCDRTLEVARSVERASSIPQLVPVIFHDAATASPLDYSEYFRSTVARFRAEGYSVVEFLSEDFSLFRKLGVWSALLELVSEQNDGVPFETPSGKDVNSARSRRVLEEACKSSDFRIILAAENLAGLDKGTLGEIVFALSEVWDTIPVTLLLGQFVKKEYIYSVIPKNVLTKMYPTSVSIPGGQRVVESVLRKMAASHQTLIDSDLFLGPNLLIRLCEILLEYQCSTHILKRFLRSMQLHHTMTQEASLRCLCAGKAERAPAALSDLRKVLGLGKEGAEAVWTKYQAERTKLCLNLYSFGLRVRMVCLAASVLFKSKDAYLRVLKAGAACMAGDHQGKREAWEEGSIFHGLRSGIAKSGKQKLVELIEAWKALVAEEDASPENSGAKAFLSRVSARLIALSEAEADGAGGRSAEAPRASRAPQTKRGSRRQALTSHIRSLASDGQDGGLDLPSLQASCTNFFVAICEVPREENPLSSRLAGPLLMEGGDLAARSVAPSIPSDVASSVRDPGAFLLRTPNGGKSEPLAKTEDSSICFHFVRGYAGTIPVEEVFDQFQGVASGAITDAAGGARSKKRKRGGARRTTTARVSGANANANANANASEGGGASKTETYNVRFERAIQELSHSGLIRITKRKMNKFVSSIFE